MNELIKIEQNENNEPCVSGRTLHEFLEVETPYHIWFPRMIEYGFVENIDFMSFEQNCSKPQGGRPKTDHIIKLDMAKELAMVQRTEKGKQAREYFIAIEKAYNSPEQIMARALQIADSTIKSLTNQVQLMKPKAEYFDALVDRNLLLGIRYTAKELHLKQNQFRDWLMDGKYIFRDKKGQLKPYSQFTPIYFELKEFVKPNGVKGTQMLITPKGRETFRLLLIKDGLIDDTH